MTKLGTCDGYNLDVDVRSATRRFRVTFESGNDGLNNDQSLAAPDYTNLLMDYTISNGGSFFVSNAQIAGHRADDGHWHTFRVRFNDLSLGGNVGTLDYFAGHQADHCGFIPEEQRVADVDAAVGEQTIPTQFGLHQHVAGSDPSLSIVGAASTTAETGNLAALVASRGILSLQYDVPTTGEAERVLIEVYDLRGRRVRRLLDDRAQRGRHVATWDRTNDAGHGVAPGVYVAVMTVGGRVFRTKLIVPAAR